MFYGWMRHEPIFENVDASVDQGKLVAVMGSHGSGKAKFSWNAVRMQMRLPCLTCFAGFAQGLSNA